MITTRTAIEFQVLYLIFITLLIPLRSCDSINIKNMEADKVVPDVIDVIPSNAITVKYPSVNKEVQFGSELTPRQVKDEPTVSWNADPNKYYLLVMTDPDAPAAVREVKHWLVGNIKGDNLSTGEVFADYRGSGPPKGTGLHRYIFLVYEQQGKIDFNEPKIGKDSVVNRLNFSVRQFAKKYNLGNPLAGNYFKAQWDEYVDERNKAAKKD